MYRSILLSLLAGVFTMTLPARTYADGDVFVDEFDPPAFEGYAEDDFIEKSTADVPIMKGEESLELITEEREAPLPGTIPVVFQQYQDCYINVTEVRGTTGEALIQSMSAPPPGCPAGSIACTTGARYVPEVNTIPIWSASQPIGSTGSYQVNRVHVGRGRHEPRAENFLYLLDRRCEINVWGNFLGDTDKRQKVLDYFLRTARGQTQAERQQHSEIRLDALSKLFTYALDHEALHIVFDQQRFRAHERILNDPIAPPFVQVPPGAQPANVIASETNSLSIARLTQVNGYQRQCDQYFDAQEDLPTTYARRLRQCVYAGDCENMSISDSLSDLGVTYFTCDNPACCALFQASGFAS